MASDSERVQRKIDALFAEKASRGGHPLERIVQLAKAGAAQPDLLKPEDIRVICTTLLSQYAQMGIG